MAVTLCRAVACLLIALACCKGEPREPTGPTVEADSTPQARTDMPASAVPGHATDGDPPVRDTARDGTESGSPRAGQASRAVSADDCSTLPRQACMESTSCILVHEPRPPRRDLYRCRPAEPPCEVLVQQSAFSGADREGARRQCEARSDCVFEEADCYCPCRGSGQTSVPDGQEAPSCNCACGGGPPAGCKARS